MLRIMVVDDSIMLRKNVINILELLGYEVVAEAGNGYEAIEKYKLLKPDIVTMDISMPMEQGIKDGIEALKHIIKYDKDAKVIMVTAHGEEEMVMDAIKLGAKGYMLKPVNKEKMLEVLEKIKF